MVYSLIYAVLFLVISYYLVMRVNGRRRTVGKLRLPPGSMGWPYFGETFQLYTQNPNVFFSSREKRYGEIFKTHLLGYPCVMLASPEAARFVLVTHAHLFKPTYPRSKERMIGPCALFFHQGEYHTKLRKLVQSSLAPETLRRLVPAIDSSATDMLRSWEGRVLSTFHEMKKLSFDMGILTIFGGHLDKHRRDELKKNYFVVDKGYNSLPNKLPGSLYNKAIEARRRLRDILGEIMEERRHKGTAVDKDLLSSFVEWRDAKGDKLTDEQISDNIIGVLFAAQDTTASVLTWIVKYLHDDPKLLDAVKAEQMAICESHGCGRQPLTWAHTRRMPLTQSVLLESLRMASIISFTFREAVADVEYEGYLIPKGWKVMPLFRNIHHNPQFFPDPHKFNPSRFEISPKPNTFLPFGNGVHSCPGNELAKLEILIFVHLLVTQYRFEVVGTHGSEVEYSPFPVPKLGLPVRLWRLPGVCGNADARRGRAAN